MPEKQLAIPRQQSAIEIVESNAERWYFREFPHAGREGGQIRCETQGSAIISLLPTASSLRLSWRMPDADPRFSEFIILQAQNAGLFLGQIPHPATGEKTLNLRAARSVLDSLEMLAHKTKGNLTEKEEKLLSTAIGNLRPLFDKASAN